MIFSKIQTVCLYTSPHNHQDFEIIYRK